MMANRRRVMLIFFGIVFFLFWAGAARARDTSYTKEMEDVVRQGEADRRAGRDPQYQWDRPGVSGKAAREDSERISLMLIRASITAIERNDIRSLFVYLLSLNDNLIKQGDSDKIVIMEQINKKFNEIRSGNGNYMQLVPLLNRLTAGDRTGRLGLFTLRLINYVVLAVTFVGVVIVVMFLWVFLKRKSPVCPISRLRRAARIQILASEDRIVDVLPDDPVFAAVLNNLSDDRREPQENVAFVELRVTSKGRRYTLEVSDLGWNFKGEPRSSRAIKDTFTVMRELNDKIEGK